jgi:hypothetical protein
MRITTSAAALGILIAMAACAGGLTTPSGLCTGEPVVQANGAVFMARGPATAAEAGALFSVVARERIGCDDVVITVTDSAAPRRRHDPWVDGDASMLRAGTELYERVGSVPGTELVAQRAPGEWVRLAVKGVE